MKDLLKLNKMKFKDDEVSYSFLLDSIKAHTKEIRPLHDKKDPHEKKEIADLYLLAEMFLELNNINKETIRKRIKKIREKIEDD